MADAPAEYLKPLPVPTKEDRPFWEALSEHRFILPQCTECGQVWFPPYLNCVDCLSLAREWIDASGTGVVDAVTVFEKPYLSSFTPDLPYNVCLIKLDEGPRLYSNLVNIANDEIRVGMSVRIVFDDVKAGVTLPRFEPAQ